MHIYGLVAFPNYISGSLFIYQYWLQRGLWATSIRPSADGIWII